MKIAAVQADVKFADVHMNLLYTENIIRLGKKKGAELVLLPEFFTSAVGFSKQMLDVASKDRQVPKLLTHWAEKYHIIIGGSYIALENSDAYNLFELVFPNGETYRHKKDMPTQFENCYYTDGDTDNILVTPIGNIGVALCWEMIRYDTVKRMAGKVDFVLAGSCWWDLPENAPVEREPLRKYNQELALSTPVEFAKLVNVPVIHANHCGKVTSYNFPSANTLQTRRFVGAAQIIDGNGTVISRRSFSEGEGIVVDDVKPVNSQVSEQRSYPDRFWIPDLPESYINAWNTVNPKAKEYYKKTAKPYYLYENKTLE